MSAMSAMKPSAKKPSSGRGENDMTDSILMSKTRPLASKPFLPTALSTPIWRTEFTAWRKRVVILGAAALGVAAIPLGFVGSTAMATTPTSPESCTPDGAYTSCLRFTFTGADQTFVVPYAVSSIKINVWAGAGSSNAGYGGTGGGGGFSEGLLPVTTGVSYKVEVGGGGTTTGAYGGGGKPGFNLLLGNPAANSGGGGRSAVYSGANFVIAAGGGGGDTQQKQGGFAGGAGGGLTGGGINGVGATQTAGGLYQSNRDGTVGLA